MTRGEQHSQGRSEHRQSVHSHSVHSHWDEFELFEAASDFTSPPTSCEACALRLAQLRAGLTRLRELGAAGDARDAALAERILAVTVSETLDWRGDLRIVVAFAREALRTSPWLRLAAALLVFHAAALPVLAWIVLRTDPPAPHFYGTLEPLPREPAFAEPDAETALPLESSNAVEPGVVEVTSDDEALAARWRDERTRQARELRSFDWPAADAASKPDEAFELRLWMRARQALYSDAPPVLSEPERGALNAEASETRRLDLLALELELELDRVVRADGSGAAAGRAAALAELLTSRSKTAGAASELARLALIRASQLGASRPSAAAGERGSVFAAGWFEALERAAPDRNSPALRAWLARDSEK